MKHLILSLLTLAMIATTELAPAQNTVPPAPTTGHRIGLIDMAHVFEKYQKFQDLRNELKTDVATNDATAKQMVERVQKMQEEIKQLDSGSPQYVQQEKQLLNAKSEFDAFRAATQRQLVQREAEMYKAIYTDVATAVKLYAEYANFDHVMRFNRKGIDPATSPKDTLQMINKSFVYSKQGNDITDPVLDYLNRNYANTGGGANQISNQNQPPQAGQLR